VDIGKLYFLFHCHPLFSFVLDLMKKYQEMGLQINLYSTILMESMSTLKMDRSTSLNLVDIESENSSHLNGQKKIILTFLYHQDNEFQQS
jgi:hypothetical protein